jgi:hypothetical protein
MTRTIVLSFCVLFTLAVMISSCSKPLDQPGFPGLRCAFGNQEYIADTAYYRKIGESTQIIALTGGFTRFFIYLQRLDTTGNYALDTITNTAYYFDGVDTFRSISGSGNISQYYNDSLHMISGSFNFYGRVPGASGKSLSITYGYFNNIPSH